MHSFVDFTPWLTNLPEGTKCDLFRHASIVKKERGEHILRAGDWYRDLYFIQNGFASSQINTLQGNNHVSMIAQEGFTLPYAIPLVESQSHINIIALTPIEMIRIDRKIFGSILERDGNLRDFVMEYLRKVIYIQDEFIFVLTNYNNTQKVAWALMVVFLGYYGVTAKKNFIPIAQIMIAENLAISRQSVNEILQSLKETGAIEIGRSQISLLDMDKLRSILSDQMNGDYAPGALAMK